MKLTGIALLIILFLLSAACHTEREIYSINTIEHELTIRKWLVCGPFPGDVDLSQFKRITQTDTSAVSDFLYSIGGETLAFPAAGTLVKLPELKLERRWIFHKSKSPAFDLNQVFEVNKGDFEYLFSHLKSRKTKTAQLKIEFTGELKLLLNGKLIYDNEAHPDSGTTALTLPVQFQDGANKLLAKMTRIADTFAIQAKIVIPKAE